MRFLSLWLPVIGVCALIPPGAVAEETPTQQELRELRQTLQQQTKQIELLAEQVGRLTRVIEGQKAAESTAPATAAETPKPSAESAPEASRAEAVPKAEAVGGGTKHVVAKGETLTSIAKQYNIPLAELKNANKIENERKLQIGQVLTIPATKSPETPDKKENP